MHARSITIKSMQNRSSVKGTGSRRKRKGWMGKMMSSPGFVPALRRLSRHALLQVSFVCQRCNCHAVSSSSAQSSSHGCAKELRPRPTLRPDMGKLVDVFVTNMQLSNTVAIVNIGSAVFQSNA